LLYLILARARSDLGNMVAALGAEDAAEPAVRHALDVRRAVALGDYRQLGVLAADAPNMGGYLMDHFMPRERALAVQAMCRAYRPSVPVAHIRASLGLDSDADALELLAALDAVLLSDTQVDTKASMPYITAKAGSFSSVDIKGQL
jgi:SAC3 family protein LENG8/THP3